MQLFEKIKSLLADNETDNALEIAEQAIQTYPGEAEGYFLCAEIYSDKQMEDKVVEHLEKACLLSPDSVKYLGRLAEMLLQVGKIDESVSYYKRVLKIEPAAWAYIGLGNAYERTGEIARCIKSFKQALKLRDTSTPPSADLLTRMIKLQKLEGDLDGVIESLQMLIPVVTDEAEKYDALCNLARSYYLLDKYPSAIDNYQLAMEISNDLPTAFVGIADIYHKLAQTDNEIDALQKANQIEENYELTQRLVALLQKSNAAASDTKKAMPFSDAEKKKLTASDYSDADLSALINAILQSSLFNHLFYRQQTGIVLGIADAVEHFLRTGAAQGLRAMPLFDPKTYQQLNPDLPALTEAQGFVHYVFKGRAEKRYYNRAILKRDASDLRVSPDFDGLWYASLIKDMPDDLNCYEHYLTIGWRQNLPPNREGFDNSFYLACYKDAGDSDYPPYLHYLKHKKGRICSQSEANQMVQAIHQSDEFDSALYCIQYKGPIPKKLPDILHYICRGVELKLDPNSSFSTEYYIRKYPDILSSGMNPFIHYLTNGKREGRAGKFDAQKYIISGKRQFDPDKPTILVVCHEATPTGAPILGLRLIEQLSQQANVVSWVGRTGSLTEKETLRENFATSSVATIEHFFDHIDSIWMVRELSKRFLLQVAILNSAATAGIGNVLFEERVPIVALVHEYGDYMTDQVSQIVFTANRIVLPSQSVKNSFDDVSVRSIGYPRTQIAIRHQGRCILPLLKTTEVKKHTRKDILLKLEVQEGEETPAIVFGCGTVTIRKGVEYFIEAARLCKNLLDKPVRFIWVGSGYLPYSDFTYSVWLKSQIKFCGLEDDVIIFEETTDLTPFFELADVFFLSSRLDPFPNVAIDAVCAGVPIVAFDKVTGFSEFIKENPEVGAVAPCLDVNAAAVAICDYITGKRARHTKNSKIIDLFSFSSYADFIWQECQTAIKMQQAIVEESNMLHQAKCMDVEFYKSGTLDWRLHPTPEYRYVAMWARGIPTEKSRVGFNDRVAESLDDRQKVSDGTITPLARVLKSMGSPFSHNVLLVNTDQLSGQWSGKLAVALHIHAYYIDDLPSFLSRLGRVGRDLWLCITTDTNKKAKTIRAVVDSFSFNADIEVVTNRGRDIGPFIMSMKKHLPRFDIIGHFHFKGSKHIEQSVVLQWQNFVNNTLIGNSGEILNELLCAFEKNPKIGLLFPEDPCSVSWTKNFSYGQELMDKLGIKRELPKEIEFPGGNMFIARTAALMPLMDYDWQWSDFMAEPVPIDGTLLHAIERITPIVCEEAGYQWLTVHNPAIKRYIHEDLI
ncbi:rhamnan synthesis F family protein [Methylovulum sp.]|uniref:rhamnan synthesis F family protein n=1 Tax=Methylovulum sp. TaxID=1916980 RepID=UPI0026314DDE|nr:rhamnan synthesis F family protein [Methylovulum sp.]